MSDPIELQTGTQHIDLWYPDRKNPPHVVIGLVHVRAADDIRISFDFDRNGYVIERAMLMKDDFGDDRNEWVEVAFVDGDL